MSTKVTTDLIWNGAKVSKDFDLAQFKSLYQSAALVEGQAKASAPTDTGLLRQSITKDVKPENATIGTNVEYAPYVEFGTRRQKAQPYLLPSLIKNVKRIIKIFAKNGINLKWVSR